MLFIYNEENGYIFFIANSIFKLINNYFFMTILYKNENNIILK